jgi:glucose-1-phosphate adenylyltransferase
METPASLNDLQRATLAIVLAGGRGTRLGPLTNKRVKPAVHFGGKYRIIDFALSNCLNSGIRRIAVVTQYKAHSLIRHLQRGWGFLRGEFNEFIDIWPAQQRVEAATGTRHGGRRLPESRHHPLDRTRNTSSCWPATTSTRWITRA